MLTMLGDTRAARCFEQVGYTFAEAVPWAPSEA